jgi:hypothetical protein
MVYFAGRLSSAGCSAVLAKVKVPAQCLESDSLPVFAVSSRRCTPPPSACLGDSRLQVSGTVAAGCEFGAAARLAGLLCGFRQNVYSSAAESVSSQSMPGQKSFTEILSVQKTDALTPNGPGGIGRRFIPALAIAFRMRSHFAVAAKFGLAHRRSRPGSLCIGKRRGKCPIFLENSLKIFSVASQAQVPAPVKVRSPVGSGLPALLLLVRRTARAFKKRKGGAFGFLHSIKVLSPLSLSLQSFQKLVSKILAFTHLKYWHSLGWSANKLAFTRQ